MAYYFKSLSRNIKLSKMLTKKINAIFDELLATLALGFEPDIVKLGINNSRNKKLNDVSPVKTFLTAVERSDEALKTTTMHMQVLTHVLPKDVSKSTAENIDNITSVLRGLPKRNIQKYKKLSIEEVIKINVPQKDKLAPRGINAYLKTLKSFLNFCYKRNYIEKQFDIALVKSNIDSRSERTALSIDAVKNLIASAKTVELQSAYTLLYLTGMRVSEAYKCKLTVVDGVKCFDLRDTSVKLKTKNSYRLIPVHGSISNVEMMLNHLKSLHLEYIGKQCSSSLDDGTLYSLRHSFATHLASHAVEPHFISELMGHKHETMTLSRYIKVFPVETLKNAIDTLSL